jgi:hypothetical protein
MHLGAVMTEEKPARTAADNGEHADGRDDQLELAFWLCSGFAFAFCLFGLCHCLARSGF